MFPDWILKNNVKRTGLCLYTSITYLVTHCLIQREPGLLNVLCFECVYMMKVEEFRVWVYRYSVPREQLSWRTLYCLLHNKAKHLLRQTTKPFEFLNKAILKQDATYMDQILKYWFKFKYVLIFCLSFKVKWKWQTK